MARSENQGLQIALIVFVTLTIVLAVVTFFYARSYNEAIIANDTLKKDGETKQALATSAQNEINKIKGDLIGVPATATIDNVTKTFAEDMNLFAATLSPDKKHYHDALEALWLTNRELTEQYLKAQADIKSLNDKFVQREAERDTQIQQFSKRAEDSESDLKNQLSKFNDDRARVNSTNVELNDKVTQKDTEKTQIVDRAGREMASARGEIKTLSERLQVEGEKIRQLEDNSFETAHGYIVDVDTKVRPNLAYINLGSADRLVPLISFSVHDKSANTSKGDGLKARIEVTEILGPHLASARILTEDLDNPVGLQDKVFTPLWYPGQRTHFAILGLIDLDGDGEDDRALIKTIISASEGIVDSEMDAEGKITGDITTDTRILIRGDIPTDKNKSAAEGAAVMMTKADAVGAQRIGAKDFLKMAGVRFDPRQTIRFGANGSGKRIPKESAERPPIAASSTESNFQKRRPWNKQDAMRKEKDKEKEVGEK